MKRVIRIVLTKGNNTEMTETVIFSIHETLAHLITATTNSVHSSSKDFDPNESNCIIDSVDFALIAFKKAINDLRSEKYESFEFADQSIGDLLDLQFSFVCRSVDDPGYYPKVSLHIEFDLSAYPYKSEMLEKTLKVMAVNPTFEGFCEAVLKDIAYWNVVDDGTFVEFHIKEPIGTTACLSCAMFSMGHFRDYDALIEYHEVHDVFSHKIFGDLSNDIERVLEYEAIDEEEPCVPLFGITSDLERELLAYIR